MSYFKWMFLVTIFVMSLSRSQSRDSTSDNTKSIELFGIINGMGNEYIAVLQTYLLTYGGFPETQSEFNDFVDRNKLNVDRTYWNNCSYKRTGETAEILIKIDDSHRIPQSLNSTFIIEYARGVLYVSSFAQWRKSSIVSVSGEILIANIIIDGVILKVDSYYYDGKSTLRRLTEANFKRLTNQN